MRVALTLGVLLLASGAYAHAVGFGAWRLEEGSGGRWRSSLRIDDAERASVDLQVEGCTIESMSREVDGPQTRLVGWLACPDGPGPRFSLDGLPEHMRVRVELVPRVGPSRDFLLQAETPSHELRSGAESYLGLGIVHILIGWDHVAFVLALLLLLHRDRRGWRRMLATLTAFTLGHSLTLGLAALDVVAVDSSLTEAMIAASLVLLATELARDDARTWTRRAPESVALFFGLFHGLGFAGVLAEIGLPPTDALWALLAFNGGVEIGQLLVALAALALGALATRLPRVEWRRVAAYALGCAGIFVTLERLFGA